MSEIESIRLAKRLAEQQQCSRREAELLIVAGHVRVDGELVQLPETRVLPAQVITVDQGARPDAVPPVTLLLHKPAGYTQWPQAQPGRNAPRNAPPSAYDLLKPENLAEVDTPHPIKVLQQHFRQLQAFLPIPVPASGLVVFTQDKRVARKLAEEGQWLEQECIAGVEGRIADGGLELLQSGLPVRGSRRMPPCKVSWQNERHLRFALKGIAPEEIESMCAAVGLTVVSLRRLRIGRVSLAQVPEGQWRYLMPWERF
ncbi:pseudouridine synthase [Comamonas terrae]|uniref:Dual-specificity RNA pseudouridine synthase RluF n=1 Tax=Comamonas terrae TaxID=673548 RepID=A0ABW5UP35_9BURK|nr:RNA pseudouridine synthase [Comamonas terrae]